MKKAIESIHFQMIFYRGLLKITGGIYKEN